MRSRRVVALLVPAGVAMSLSAAAIAGGVTTAWPPVGSSGQQTHPKVRPRAAGPRSTFTLTFTLRQAPGHAGVIATDYRIELSRPHHAPASCQPSTPKPVETGRKGQIARRFLRPPRNGWCKGVYTVMVVLERGPYCPPPPTGEPPPPCPGFATQEFDVGEARFTVG